jgi:hypothetical protein
MGFYKNAVIAFGIQLIILLVIIAVIMYNASKSQDFPSIVAKCPDFFSLNSDNTCVMAESVYSSREPRCKQMDPTGMTLRDKKTIAADCGIAWDGITNSSSI